MSESISMIIIPLVFSNILHMLVVKYDSFPALKIPVSTSLFGANKTLRGFIVLPFMNACFSLCLVLFEPNTSYLEIFTAGFLFGLAYMLAELPNSWIKRRLGIAAGASAEKNKVAFALLDKTDSSLGVALLAWVLVPLESMMALQLFILSVVTHIFFSALLLIFHLKKSF